MMDESPHQPIGQQLRRFRLAAGLSQEALAEASGVSVRTISDLERGQRPGAHLETVRLLADALGLTGEDRLHLQEAARPDLRAAGEASPDTPRFHIGSSQWKLSLPVPATRLVGRSADLDEISMLLAEQTRTVVTLTGPGGVGKTRLAVEVAQRSSSTFADGVVFVNLAPISQAELVPDAIAQVLGMAPHPTLIADRLTALLETRELLLVLDNFEHVVEAAPLVAQLNASCPRLVILVTSRVRLRISAEREYAVLPLDVAHVGTPLEHARVSGAVQLFAERAGTVDSTFALSEQNVAAVSEICRRVDGLPLAIELAASRLRVLPVETLLERLEHRLPLLTGGPRDLPRRQQSMRETIAWSYDLLEPAEQRFLRWMSVFSGGLSLDSAEALGQDIGLSSIDSLETVTTLVESGLAQHARRPHRSARFQMLETIREFGLEQLKQAGELEAARRFHATHFLELASSEAPRPGDQVHDEWVGRLATEHPNLIQAFDFLCVPETAEQSVRFAAAMGPYWHTRGRFSEGGPRLSRAFDLASLEPTILKAHVLFWTSLILGTSRDLPGALLAASRCIDMADQVGTPSDKAAAIHAMAWVQEWHEHWDIARELREQAMGLWTSVGNTFMHAICLLGNAGIECARGDLDRARREAEQAGEIFRAVGSIAWGAGTVCYQGMFAAAEGRLDLAAAFYEQSLRNYMQSASSSRWFKPLVGLADVAAAIGHFTAAARLLGAADEMLIVGGRELMPFDRPGYSRAETRCREALGSAGFEEHRMAGSRLTPDEWLADSSAIVEGARRFSASTTS